VIDRREFLALCAALAAACRKQSLPAVTPSQAGKALGANEWRTLDACCARILPSGALPGAREAKVIDFVDGQLASAELASLAPLVIAGARHLDEWAQREKKSAFAALPDGEQDAALAALAAGTLVMPQEFPQAAWFRFLHTLTLEGFLSDPSHGGNAGGIGWRALGIG
jgi:gluconate 2-dehydrogenase gamma chain